MIPKVLTFTADLLTRLLNGFVALGRIFAEGWRWWVAAALLGGLLLGGYALTQPPLYRSTGTITFTPRFWLEGYMLATQQLTDHYAVRLISEERVARAMTAANTTIDPILTTTPRSGIMVDLTVAHPDPATTELITRLLLNDLQQELLTENRTRAENDRLYISRSLTSFATPAHRPWWQWALVGLVGGWGSGVLFLYGYAFRVRNRLFTAREVERVLDLQPLALIPRK